jgi:membrane protein
MSRHHEGITGRLRQAGSMVLETIGAFQANQGSLMAAGLAYFLLISASPLFVVAIAAIGAIMGREQAQVAMLDRISTALGPEAAQTIDTMVREVDILAGGLAASLIAVAVLLYGSTRAFAALQRSLDVIWEVPSVTSLRKGMISMVRSRALAFVMVVAMGVVMVLTLALDTFSSSLILQVEQFTPAWGRVISVANRLVLAVVRISCLAMIYRGLPACYVSWRDVWPGSLFAVLLLGSGHSLIKRYVAYSGVRSAYGAAGSVIVLLLSFYFAAFVVLVGAQFCKVYAQHRKGKAAGTAALRG